MNRPLRLAALCAALAGTPALAGTLEVRLDHLRPNSALHVALYRDAASWRQQRGAYAERVLPRPQPDETLRFELPPGRYAVSASQDADRSTLMAMPMVLPRHGDSGGGAQMQASFERAAIRVEDADPDVRVHLYTDNWY
jgi:uncharacterized protein (DUF2141 family)